MRARFSAARCRARPFAHVCSILYQRGIYPPETFKKVSKYGLTMLVTTDTGLSDYLEQVLSQLSSRRAHTPPPCPLV